jgi:hypothetical protein
LSRREYGISAVEIVKRKRIPNTSRDAKSWNDGCSASVFTFSDLKSSTGGAKKTCGAPASID